MGLSELRTSRHERLMGAFLEGVEHLGGATFGGADSAPGVTDLSAKFSIDHPRVFVRLLRKPGSLGAARSYIAGDVSASGETLALARGVWQVAERKKPLTFYRDVAVEAACSGLVPSNWRGTGRLPIEYRPRSPLASVGSDRRRLSHHYALPVEFYSVLLGPSMTYSGAIFAPGRTLLTAQEAKHQRVLEQLSLRNDGEILDIGAGWGGFAQFCQTKGLPIVGITPVSSQVDFARERGLQVTESDFRSFDSDRTFAGVVSIGVFEHIGLRRANDFFESVRSWMEPQARYVNQTIVRKASARTQMARNSFTSRFIWPGGELVKESQVVASMEQTGLRVFDVYRFGESYARTLECWLENLEQSWDYCVELVGEQRCRAWQLYLAGTSVMFETEMLDVVQVTSALSS